MKNLLTIAQLTPATIEQILARTAYVCNGWQPDMPEGFTCIYSFEGNSLRTRATFLKALAYLGITAIELPNLLKTSELKPHLAGYLDQWADLYIIRERDHAVMTTFADASTKPVINAMSAAAHPCEVLADLYWLTYQYEDWQTRKYCIVGEQTNVLRSWLELGEVLSLDYRWVTPAAEPPFEAKSTSDLVGGLRGAQIILTDTWNGDFDPAYQITLETLQVAAKDALVIPCPPFTEDREVAGEVIQSGYFAGYGQKRYLYEVQVALILTLLGHGYS